MSDQTALAPVLMPTSRDQLLLAAVEQILRELQTLNMQVAQIKSWVNPLTPTQHQSL